MSNKPHISHPLEEARTLINSANHHVYRAGYQDSAYELSRAMKQLKIAISIIEKVQQEYPIAHPSKIDTSLPPDDLSLSPGEKP